MSEYTIINATFVNTRLSGIERYCLNLVSEFSRQPLGPKGSLILLAHPDCPYWSDLPAHIKVIKSPFRNRILNDQAWVPWILMRLRPALVHYPAFAPPFLNWTPFVLTIHDAVFWRHPEVLSMGGKWYYKPLLNWAVRSRLLRAIITVSESSRRDLVNFLGLDLSDISSIPLAASSQFVRQEPGAVEETLRRLRLPRRYLLSVGTLEPRKNLACVIDAFHQISEDYPDLGLVIVGRKGWIADLKIPDDVRHRVHFTGTVADEDLPAIYSGAEAFVFPSLYEGFGLPLLEALACGVPCIVAHTSSLPEVGGNACLYADPMDPSEFAQCIRRIISDPKLVAELGESRNQQITKFSWKETAERTLGIYERASQVLPEKFSVMGIEFDSHTMSSLIEDIAQRVTIGNPSLICTVNVDFLATAYQDKHFKTILSRSNIVVADGMPIVWLSKILGPSLQERIAGSDLTVELCRQSTMRGFKLFFLGAGPGVAAQARDLAMSAYNADVCGVYAPSFEELASREGTERILERIRESGANILLVALGSPKQEKWIVNNLRALPTAVNIGVGASLDFLAGRVSRAPSWMQVIGLEWFYRLIAEPKRLWKRYLIKDALFILIVFQEIIRRFRRILDARYLTFGKQLEFHVRQEPDCTNDVGGEEPKITSRAKP